MIAVSSLHASLIMAQSTAADIIDTIAFLSELWDENTDHINQYCQRYTGIAINLIEAMIAFLTADRTTVKALSSEVLDEIQEDQQEILQHAYITHEVFQGIIHTFILPPVNDTELDDYITEECAAYPASLETLKEIAKSLKIKGYNFYKCPIKLQAKIAEAMA